MKKGADTGIDGIVWFKPDGRISEKAIISVKGGEKVGVAMVKDVIATVNREKAKIGLFVTLTESGRPMRTEALTAGFYETPWARICPRSKFSPSRSCRSRAGSRRSRRSTPAPFRKAPKEDTSHDWQVKLL